MALHSVMPFIHQMRVRVICRSIATCPEALLVSGVGWLKLCGTWAPRRNPHLIFKWDNEF